MYLVMYCLGRIKSSFALKTGRRGLSSGSLSSAYKSLRLVPDANQLRVVTILEKLLFRLQRRPAEGSSDTCKGIYLCGSVGTGKTMLMDLLYSHVALPKKRTHFHKFMLEIHQRIHAENQRLLEKHGRQVNVQLSPGHDAVVNVAGNLAAECRVLCFDEFQITDIADAWIISRLINALWDRGVVLVATSNRPLDDLYQNGLNRRYFLPFIESLKNHSVVLALDSNMDYRVLNNVQADPSYFVPLGSESSVLLYTAYLKYCSRIQNRSSTALTIEVMSGRSLTLPKGLLGEVCWCDFEHLCCQDRGAADYKALCKNFHTIFLDGVPQLSVLHHDKARRFITLIDEIYDAGARLVWAAEKHPSELFIGVAEQVLAAELEHGALVNDSAWETDVAKAPAALRSSEIQSRPYSVVTGSTQASVSLLDGQLSSVQELDFAFRRASSRMTEMASVKYCRNHSIRYLRSTCG